MKEQAIDLSPLEEKLDVLIKLMAMLVVADAQSLKERAARLQRAGLTPKEIAALCDSTPNAVSVALSNAKKEGKG